MQTQHFILTLYLSLSLLVLSSKLAFAQSDSTVENAPPLYDDLGTLHYKVTANAEAQRYFDQGMRLYYAFNHAESIAAFREAQRLDENCAMCWWGEALAWGPNINLPMDSESGLAAFDAVQVAQSLTGKASAKERQLISALSERYEAIPAADRRELDLRYADVMEALARQYPQDDEIVVLYAESVMDLSPWDYWTAERKLRPRLQSALEGLQTVMQRSPEHPGACHFYIHAVEEHQPERAVACAENLAALMPGAGHLVHMPGHIYIRVGRYLDAIKANEHAVHADETYIQDRRPAAGMYTDNYYPHNYDFLSFAALMIGREEQSIEAADTMADLVPEAALQNPALTFPQHYIMRSLLVRIPFKRWGEIMDTPEPDDTTPHAQAIWDYAQGRALLATGNTAGARAALYRLQAHASSTELANARLSFNGSQQILDIASNVLAGMIANREGDLELAKYYLQRAVELEDSLLYGEPPEWTIPVRQEYGEVLLAAGHASLAEEVFRADLEMFRENYWSLNGLFKALTAQGKAEEAHAVEERRRRITRANKSVHH